jgi:hypothetical protein
MVIKSRMRWTEYEELTQDMRNTYKIPLRKPEGKKALSRPRQICENDIKMDIK